MVFRSSIAATGHETQKSKEIQKKDLNFQEMKKERSARAKKKVEKKVLINLLKVAGMTIEAQVEKYTEFLLCPITFQLLREPNQA